jgi:NADH-quinone oxidoreductase subunit L
LILPINIAAWLVIMVPLLGSLLTPIFAKINGTLRDIMAVLFGSFTAFIALDMIPDMFASPTSIDYPLFKWIIVGNYEIEFGVLVDPLSVLLVNIAGGIGFLIILFSIDYMTKYTEDGRMIKDPSLTRYYFFMQFFIAGMILLVMANNLLMTFIGWEIVGMCSYALIGFWHNASEPSPVQEYKTEGEYNAMCGMKAFMVTRVGDVGLLAGILLLYFITGTFNYTDILETAPVWIGTLTSTTVNLLPIIGILLFMGSIGKSAQFPLHIWLPEAMAGPTTVSALIHAAAMVKAGVYLVARIVPIFIEIMIDINGLILFFQTIAVIGAISAFMSATMAVVQDEIKKVLAYSTISQLGYMFMALGAAGMVTESVSAYSAGALYLLAHAVFKALLFLGAGSVLHSVQSKNMHDMGGLKNDMKITFATFMVGALSLAGVFPFIGFWFKEMIFEALWLGQQYILFFVAFLTAILTAFYSFRMVGMTFFGEKSAHVQKLESHGHHIHEAPTTMTIPLLVLAGIATIGGFLEPFFLSFFAPIGQNLTNPFEWTHVTPFALGLTTLFTLVVWILGITPAYLIYWKNKYDFSKMKDGRIYKFLWNRWYLNQVYYRVFVKGFLSLSNMLRVRIESAILSSGKILGRGLSRVSENWRRTMTGVLNTNVLGMMVGIVVFLMILIFL